MVTSNLIINSIKHSANNYVENKYNVIEYVQGHISKSLIYNPVWIIDDNTNLMYCEKDVLIKLNNEEYEKLKKFNSESPVQRTWFYTNSKGEHILSRIKNVSVNLHHVINTFNKMNIIKIDTDFKYNIKFEKTNNTIRDFNNNFITTDIVLTKYDRITQHIAKLKKIENDIKITTGLTDDFRYTLIKKYKGHYRQYGCKIGYELNKMWKVFDKDINKNIYLMYCEPDTLVRLCKKSIKKIIEFEEKNTGKITWNKLENGYIMGCNSLYMHQVITGCHGNGRGTMELSVDHIDRNPLNNSFDNLRIATREEQQSNTLSSDGERRARKHNAKPLPDGITNDMLCKYVVYYKECYNKENNLYREFFKIEKHPKLEKQWIGCKSNKVSIEDKLKAVNDMANSLNLL